jgi:fimbrial isopeptide formation D2 family protein
MLRMPGTPTRANDKRQVIPSLNLTQRKIILTLLVAAFATIPLWLGLARVHSASSNLASPTSPQPPAVVLNVPSEVLIGEDFEFEVRLKNNLGSSIGYAPYVDLYLPASGVDGNSAGLKCDGITFLSARALFTSPPSLTLPVAQDTGMDTSANPCPNSYSTHPFTGATIFSPTPQYQHVVVPLPFGSFDPTQPENIIKVKAHLSDYADAGTPLTIYARGGFRYGADEQDNHPTDPLVESAPVSAQTTPTLLRIKKEYLGPEDEAVSGPNFVNYYPLKYRVTVDIADLQLIQNLVVTDKLPANLQFNGNVQITIQGNNANVVTSCSATPGPFDVVIASPPSTPGGTLSVTLCSSLTGSAAPDDVVVTFDFFVPDLDANGQIIIKKDCSNAPVAVNNDILATGDWDPRDPRDAPPNTTVPVNSNLTNVDHILNAKCLAIQKSVKMFQEFPGGAIGPTPGDVLRYELNFQVSDYFTIGKLVVTDFLADGQTFLGGPPPTLRVTDLFGNTGAPTAFPPLSVTTSLNQSAATAFCPVKLQTPQLGTIVRFDVSLAMLILPPFIPRHDAGMLTGGLAAGPPTSTPTTGTIVFYARINDAFKPPVSALHKFVDKHDPINNCVSIKGAVYDNLPRPTPLNAPLSIPTSIIGSAADGSAVQTTIVGADLKKKVWAVRRGTAMLCGPLTPPARPVRICRMRPKRCGPAIKLPSASRSHFRPATPKM